MKKKLALSLALMFSLGMTGTVFAASEPDMAAELASLKARMAELEKSMATAKVSKKKDNDNKLSFEGSDYRVRWIKDGADDGDSAFMQRIRLNMNYKVNDKIAFNTRWRVLNENEFGKAGSITDSDGKTALQGKDSYFVSDVNMAIKDVLGSTMTIGRFSQAFGTTNYWNSTAIGLIDGVKFDTKINDLKVAAGYANFGAFATPTAKFTTTSKTTYDSVTKKYTTTSTTTQTNTSKPKLEDAVFLNASYPISKATNLNAMWVKEVSGADSNFNVRGLGVNTQLNNDFKLVGDYNVNYGQANNPSGYYVSLRWKGAKDDVPGSFGMRLDYRDIKAGNMFSSSGTGVSIPTEGYKGPAISAHYAMDKNIILEGFQTFKTKDADTGDDLPNYSRVQLTVGF